MQHDELRGSGGVRLHSLQADEERRERELMNLKMEVAHLRERLHMRVGGETNAIELEDENFTLKRSLHETQHALVEHQDALREMDAKYAKAMLNLVKLDQAWKASAEDQRTAQANARDADERAQQLQHALDALRYDQRTAVAAIETRANEREAQQCIEIERLAMQVRDLEHERDSRNSNNSSTVDAKAFDDLQRQYELATAQCKKQKNAIDAMQIDNAALRKQVQQLGMDHAAAQLQFAEIAANQMRECQQLQQALATRDATLQQLQSDGHDATLQQLQSDGHDATLQLHSIAKLLAADNSNSDDDNDSATLYERLERLLQRLQTTDAALAIATQQRETLERKLAKAQALAVENATLQSECKRLRAQVEAQTQAQAQAQASSSTKSADHDIRETRESPFRAAPLSLKTSQWHVKAASSPALTPPTTVVTTQSTASAAALPSTTSTSTTATPAAVLPRAPRAALQPVASTWSITSAVPAARPNVSPATTAAASSVVVATASPQITTASTAPPSPLPRASRTPPRPAVNKRPLEERVELLRQRAKRKLETPHSALTHQSVTTPAALAENDVQPPAGVASTRVKVKRAFVQSRYLASAFARRSDR